MRKLQQKLFLLALILTCLMLPASGLAAETYKDTKNEYSIVFPNGWEVRENVGGILAIALSPAEGSSDVFRENINITIEELPSDMSAEEYLKAGETQLTGGLTNFKKLDGGNTKDYSWIKYNHEMQGYKFAVTSNAFIKGKKAYVVTCTALHDSYDSFKTAFDASLKTFKITAK